VHARVYDDSVVRVEVVLDAAPSVVLPVVGGHALGTIPNHTKVLAMVGRDQTGSEVARFTLAKNGS
jgi:hypothetical protein